MSETISKFCSDYIWGIPLVAFIVCSGLWFGIHSRFRYLTGLFQLKKAFAVQGGDKLRPFSVFTLSVGGKVGVGNIVGIYMAVNLGGPGAVLWMAVFSLIGAAISYTECKTGALKHGGPPAYMKSVGWKLPAGLFSILILLLMGICMPAIQVNTVASAVSRHFGGGVKGSVVVGCCLAAIFFFGVCFGEKKTAELSAKLLPVAAGFYILLALTVISFHYRQIPAAFAAIWNGAFGPGALASGAAFTAASVGIRRAMFCCEAGYGIAPYAAAKAAGEPHQIGTIQGFATLFNILGICCLTGLMRVVTGDMVASSSLDGVFGLFGEVSLLAVLVLFAYTALLCCGFTVGVQVGAKLKIVSYIVMMGIMVCASAAAPELVWAVGDGICGLLTVVNLLSLWRIGIGGG